MIKTIFPLLLACAVHAADAPPAESPVRFRSPQEQLRSFLLPEGYHLEPVLTEPQIQDPVAAAFDGDGRLYVAEMRTYMQDIDATGQHKPTSRVSVHWSSKGDGNYDRHAVFADGLLLPRMIVTLGPGELLINETDTQDIFLWRDKDGDGVADEKKPWYVGGPRGGNMEHQQSGLLWTADNWLYMAMNAWRLRWQGYDKPPLKESTPGNGGQWGLTQDDWGKPWFINAGGERGPVNFQTHIAYGGINTKTQFAPGYTTVWPAVGLSDYQGGTGRVRTNDQTLNHFTATCGAEVFRGDRLPADLRGDLLFAEPVGRLIRRTKIRVQDGLTTLSNAYDGTEFIRSTDPCFRVVAMNTAPDGTLYLLDMYRGIIQEGNWTREGSYLRKVILQHGLDKVAGKGRIWRLTHRDFKPAPQPKLNSAKDAELVAALAHPNGWHRDTAQKLLILRAATNAAPALRTLARTHPDPLARFHALWTLEGLGTLDAALAREKLGDNSPRVRAAALRAGETLFKAGDKTLTNDIARLLKDADAGVAIQALLTTKLLALPTAKAAIQSAALGTNTSMGLREIAMQLLAPPRSWGGEFNSAEKKILQHGDVIFTELCFACHNPDGRGTPVEGRTGVTLAPPIAGSRTVNGHRDALIHVLLKGLAGPVNGKTYESQMMPMESNNDEWIAAVASFTRNSFGNKSGMVTAKDVARVRAATKERTEPWTIEELRAIQPNPPLANRAQWKLTASHNTSSLKAALDGSPTTRWDTRAYQTNGMWLQVELPKAVKLAGLALDSAGSGNDYPRGYIVELSTDGASWGSPVAKGEGRSGITEITFTPASARFVRITQTGQVKGNFWSIHELDLLEHVPNPILPAALKTKPKAKTESFE